MHAREPVSFWRENKIAVVILLRVCGNGEVAKTSPRNIGDLVFLESRKRLVIIIRNNWVKFIPTKSKIKLPVLYLILVLRLKQLYLPTLTHYA